MLEKLLLQLVTGFDLGIYSLKFQQSVLQRILISLLTEKPLFCNKIRLRKLSLNWVKLGYNWGFQ